MEWVVNATARPLNRREWPCTHCIGGWVGPTVGVDGCGKSRPHLMTGFRNVKYICCGLLQWLWQLVLPSYHMDPGTVPGQSVWDLGGLNGPGRDFTSLFLSGSLHHCSILSHSFSCHRLLYDFSNWHFCKGTRRTNYCKDFFFLVKWCSFSACKVSIIFNDQPWTNLRSSGLLRSK